MKTCPHCAEQVQDAATKCPHCKEVIYSSDPGTNSLISILVFLLFFYIIYNGINAFVEHETEKEMEKMEMESLKKAIKESYMINDVAKQESR
jgi:acetyl-CoA carboxylase beta subunit